MLPTIDNVKVDTGVLDGEGVPTDDRVDVRWNFAGDIDFIDIYFEPEGAKEAAVAGKVSRAGPDVAIATHLPMVVTSASRYPNNGKCTYNSNSNTSRPRAAPAPSGTLRGTTAVLRSALTSAVS